MTRNNELKTAVAIRKMIDMRITYLARDLKSMMKVEKARQIAAETAMDEVRDEMNRLHRERNAKQNLINAIR